jgi:hypothetical protein
MLFRNFIAFGFLGFTMLSASALDVENVAGTLATRITDYSSTTSLKITGTVNASDLYFIGTDMTALTALDLSEATIKAYSGDAINGISAYPAATIPQGCFAGTKLQDIAFPKSQSLTVGEAAFTSSALQNIAFPAANVAVEAGAFAACKQLQNVIISSSLTLGTAAFKDCTALASVDGSEHVTTISDAAFAGCSSLEQYAFGADLTAVGDYAFELSGLKTVDMGQCKQLAEVGSWAFAHDSQLQEAILGENVSNLGQAIFFDCPALESVTISEVCTTIPDYAFTNATALNQEDILNAEISEIGAYALRGVSAMTKIYLPGTLQSIGDGAMEGMTSLVEIDAKQLQSVPELGDDVWAGVDQSGVQLLTTSAMASQFNSELQWQDFHIVIDEQTDAIDQTAEITGKLQGAFSGRTLFVKVNGLDVKQLSLYNTAGVMLATALNVTEAAQFDTSSYSDRAYVVVAILADGRAASLKLAR